MQSRQLITQLQENIAQSIIGQEHVVSRLIIGLLANGNLLLEGLPPHFDRRRAGHLERQNTALATRIGRQPRQSIMPIPGCRSWR